MNINQKLGQVGRLDRHPHWISFWSPNEYSMKVSRFNPLVKRFTLIPPDYLFAHKEAGSIQYLEKKNQVIMSEWQSSKPTLISSLKGQLLERLVVPFINYTRDTQPYTQKTSCSTN